MGNRDVAPFSAMLIIAFTIMLYYFSLFFIIIVILPKELFSFSMTLFKVLSIALFFLVIIWLYFVLVHKEKYKVIIKEQEKIIIDKRSFATILFPLIGFLIFNLSVILKIMQNQGRL
jgi:hypothetical protein